MSPKLPEGREPRSVKLEVRLSPSEKQRLEAEAKRRRTRVGPLVREQLGGLIGLADRELGGVASNGVEEPVEEATGLQEPAPRPDVAPSPPEPPVMCRVEMVDLAAWLSGKTGLPPAACARDIAAGRVEIGGRVVRSPQVRKTDAAGDVKLGGQPV